MKIKINPMTDIGSIIVFTLLFSYALSIASFNPPVSAQVQNNTSLNTADTFALGNASLITDKTIYSQDGIDEQNAVLALRRLATATYDDTGFHGRVVK